MLEIIEKLRAGLVASIITAGCMGLSSVPALAGEEKEQLVKVNCDKGKSVQKILDKNVNKRKPLVLIIKGTCDEEVDEELEVVRDNVRFEGDEVVGGSQPHKCWRHHRA